MSNKTTEDIISSLIEFVNNRKVTITQNDMLKIAHLVRIKLSNEEIEYYSKELTMLDWIHNTLLQVNTEKITPMRYGSIDTEYYIQDDIVYYDNTKEDILSNAQHNNGYFIVPKDI
ncbi:Asp-tRNA(Asn)/Glu-tRNA(Gln) amidotransferase subunit GatC [Wolbachia endosymbiont of Howardula sp.]|uniref:Asp-tRNA(Asn)/Glu-tRNA(Gln) amidotransferase subunit GatC n=1 Tax=Wolbachia endosymbiont of Howardula sp. TaxID=2916816 RepID=UPI00217E472D|nr:Asp-tRNA(Asn)/Glu-tRNA(Gln) amidotransferase subunit GatC [Wolbachia endosymbiont of Howardula sp.]UWI83234.1 aspartyl/glutamyl-tRNA amidotransferase subunit C [Wolbachia endosymbiont of Howardula sp.]